MTIQFTTWINDTVATEKDQLNFTSMICKKGFEKILESYYKNEVHHSQMKMGIKGRTYDMPMFVGTRTLKADNL